MSQAEKGVNMRVKHRNGGGTGMGKGHGSDRDIAGRGATGPLVRWPVLGVISATLLVAGCETKTDVLQGERLDVREILETRYDPIAETTNQSVPINLPSMQRNSSWAQSPVSEFARVDHSQFTATPTLAWSAPIGQGDTRRKRLNVDPIAGGGLIYVMDADHRVSAYSSNGQLAWSTDITPPRDENFQAQGGGLGYANGRLFVASGFGMLLALDAQSGTQIWEQDLGNTATGAPTIYDGVVYVTGGDELGWAIEADNGRVRWRNEGIGADINNVAGAPAPAVGDTFAVFAYGNGSVYSLFRQGGLQKWNADVVGGRIGYTTATISDITGAPVVDGNRVYVGNFSGRTVALDAFTGERIWTAQDGATGQVWPAGGSVFFVSDNFQLIRLNATTGDHIWSVDLPGYVPTRRPHRARDTAYVHFGPILAGGRMIVVSSDGVMRSFDPQDGALVGQVTIPGGATTRPIVVDGTLYVVSKSGDLLAYR